MAYSKRPTHVGSRRTRQASTCKARHGQYRSQALRRGSPPHAASYGVLLVEQHDLGLGFATMPFLLNFMAPTWDRHRFIEENSAHANHHKSGQSFTKVFIVKMRVFVTQRAARARRTNAVGMDPDTHEKYSDFIMIMVNMI